MTRAGAIAALALVCAGCANGDRDGSPSATLVSSPEGTTILEAGAGEVITDPLLRAAILETGLAWRVRHDASGVEMLLVPPGSFLRGASDDDAEATADERPAHVVEIREPFYLGRYEVTQEQWQRVMGDRPGFFPAGEGAPQPVEQVPYFRAQEFATAAGLALPTESQWEAGCRAGSAAPRYGALDDVAWHRGNAKGRAHPVGEKAPNALGLHDMLGNVWEWTSSGFVDDEYARYGGPIDARGRVRGAPKIVLRGGSWFDPEKRARASARYATEREFSAGHVGLRVVLDVD